MTASASEGWDDRREHAGGCDAHQVLAALDRLSLNHRTEPTLESQQPSQK